MTVTTGKPSTCLKLTHQEVRRLLDALQGTDEPLRLCTGGLIDVGTAN